MLRFNAHYFVAISSTLGQAIMDLGSGRIPQERSMRMIVESCALLLKDCEAMDLKFSAAHIKRFREEVLQPGMTFANLRAALIEIQQRVWDEMAERTFFALSAEDSKFYDGSQFPQVILDRFQEVTFDAEEAGKCLAFERPTACVYHLMRITEYGLREISKKLGMKDDRPNWEPVICKIEAELRKPYKDREFKGLSDFLANISAYLNAVKLAWRNRVMHVERKHTSEEAREIYNATVGLMRYMVENLPPDGGLIATIRGIMK
jgi:hypothetical protein